MKPVAIVVAVAHDYPTRYVSRVTERVIDVLEAAGYDARLVISECSPICQLVADLTELKMKGTVPELAMFIAHGDENGLYAKGDPILEGMTCRLLEDAVLILCSCLKRHEFPNSILRQEQCPRGVIGFAPFMAVPQRVGFFSRLMEFGYEDAERRFFDAVLEPVLALASHGNTLTTAKERARLSWGSLSEDQSIDKRIRLVAKLNAKWVTCWLHDEIGDCTLRSKGTRSN